MKREVDALDSMADKYFTKKALGPDLKQMRYLVQRVTSCLRGPRVLGATVAVADNGPRS